MRADEGCGGDSSYCNNVGVSFFFVSNGVGIVFVFYNRLKSDHFFGSPKVTSMLRLIDCYVGFTSTSLQEEVDFELPTNYHTPPSLFIMK